MARYTGFTSFTSYNKRTWVDWWVLQNNLAKNCFVIETLVVLSTLDESFLLVEMAALVLLFAVCTWTYTMQLPFRKFFLIIVFSFLLYLKVVKCLPVVPSPWNEVVHTESQRSRTGSTFRWSWVWRSIQVILIDFTFGQNQSIADSQVYKVIYQSHQLLCSMNPTLAISKFVNVAKLVRFDSLKTFFTSQTP